jgi:thioredoxin reductase
VPPLSDKRRGDHHPPSRSDRPSVDAVVVGAGPAGLNAALMLGRTRRQVVVCDDGEPRNAASHAMHGFLSRDGTDPAALRAVGRGQLETYSGVRLVAQRVVDAVRHGRAFDVSLSGGDVVTCRKLLLASGIRDWIPPIDGLMPMYGTSVFHCPYCDGWEAQDQPIAVLCQGSGGFRLALLLLSWSRDVVLCTCGPSGLDGEQRTLLARNRVRLCEQPIRRLEGELGRLAAIVFTDGTALERRVAFFHGPARVTSALPDALGCARMETGAIEVDEGGRTSVDGVYAAGDAARRRGQHPATQVILAAASGALAGICLHQDLVYEDVGLTPALPQTNSTSPAAGHTMAAHH